MVVYVEEGEGFLFEDEENGVDEFPVFEIVVDHVVGFELHCPCSFAANGVEEAISTDDGDDFLEHQSQEKT